MDINGYISIILAIYIQLHAHQHHLSPSNLLMNSIKKDCLLTRGLFVTRLITDKHIRLVMCPFWSILD